MTDLVPENAIDYDEVFRRGGQNLGDEDFAVPPIEDIIELTVALGRRTNPAIRCGGVSLNTSAMDEAEADALCASETARLGLPVADPIRGGAAFDALIEECLKP